MPLAVIMPNEAPCARIGSRSARIIMPCRPELASCSRCGETVWVSEISRRSGLPLVCTFCLGTDRR
jgi:hypothetical protein